MPIFPTSWTKPAKRTKSSHGALGFASREERRRSRAPTKGEDYTQEGKTRISTMLPSTLGGVLSFYPQGGIDQIASKVEEVVLEIINEAK
jgi:hypothetical protein